MGGPGGGGGNPGANADGTITAGSGANTEMNSTENLSKINDDKGKYSSSGWQNGDNRAAGGSGGDSGSASTSSSAITVAPATVSLANADDNTTTIIEANGSLADVSISGRTLFKDGKWNTLCLPFNVAISGSPLDGAVARPLTAASISGTTLNLTFGDGTTEIRSLTPDPSPMGERSSYWYSLDGRRLQGKPTQKGIYIDNGRKKIIK